MALPYPSSSCCAPPMSKPPDEPGPTDMDAVIAFLPALGRPGFAPGLVVDAEERDGEKIPARFEASPEMAELILALHSRNWVCDFDWTEWQSVADHYAREPARLADAGVGTLRKLFTTHLRREQYRPGYLVEVVRSGQLSALLERVRDLRSTLPG